MTAGFSNKRVTDLFNAHPDARRRYPRVNYVTAVELEAPGATAYGFSENLSVGGMLVRSEFDLDPGTPVLVSFILSGAGRLQVPSRVVHCRPGVRIGIQFVTLTDEQESALAKFAQPNITKMRRSPRIPVRLFVQLSWTEQGQAADALAETVLISQHGCLMLTKGKVDVGVSLSLLWPEGGASARARVVSRQDCPGDLPRVAVEFMAVDNFWGTYFPPAADT